MKWATNGLFVLIVSVITISMIGNVRAERLSSQGAAAAIDETLRAEVASIPEGKTAPLIDDATFLRRISLDLTGQLPTPGKITAFVLDPSPRKRENAIEELLASDDYGKNWGRYWRDVIMFRRSDERALIAHDSLEQFLTAQLNNNVSWDEVARKFITAAGDVRENGACGLIMAQMGQPEDTVAEISRIFLGIQIQCAQCHDHITDRWKREQFHQLAAFFPRVAVRPDRSAEKRSFVVVSTDLPQFRRVDGNNRFRGTPEHFMPDLENPSARGTQMQPIFFVSGEKMPLGTKDADRRATLANWITSPENPWFARAMVNRLWSELVGEGFYEPVDDAGPDRTPKAPKTLDVLAATFTKSGYDVKELYRTIMLSEAYQRTSAPRRTLTSPPFAANCPQRLRSDQLFSSLTRTLGIYEPSSAREGGVGALAAIRGPRGQFAQLFNYDPSEPRDEIEGSIPQALALMNSREINAAISASPYTSLGKLLRNTPDNEDVVVEIYLRSLAREPSAKELQTSLNYVQQVGDRNEAFEDILWALINSTEFLFRR